MAGRILLAAIFACCLGGGAQATTIAAPRPHDAALGCTRMIDMVADFREGLPFGTPWSYREVYTDDLGKVERDEVEAFASYMLTSHGRQDRVPMEVHSIHVLGGDEFERFYVLTLKRSQWQLKRYEEDGMLNLIEIDDPHWDISYSTWLVRFSSNTLRSVRQADDLLFLKSELEPLENCPSAPDKLRLEQD